MIEIAVVFAIIAILIAIMIPAVQSARSRARNTTCQNNLRQLGLGVHLHLDAHQHLPHGGLGNHWMGLQSRGFGLSQPGGWLFNVLPYVEQQAMRTQFDLPWDQSKLERLSTTIPTLMTCPTRGQRPKT